MYRCRALIPDGVYVFNILFCFLCRYFPKQYEGDDEIYCIFCEDRDSEIEACRTTTVKPTTHTTTVKSTTRATTVKPTTHVTTVPPRRPPVGVTINKGRPAGK